VYDNKCNAIKRDGMRCTYNAKHGNYCGIHVPKKHEWIVVTSELYVEIVDKDFMEFVEYFINKDPSKKKSP
jgi:hypothetical protein